MCYPVFQSQQNVIPFHFMTSCFELQDTLRVVHRMTQITLNTTGSKVAHMCSTITPYIPDFTLFSSTPTLFELHAPFVVHRITPK